MSARTYRFAAAEPNGVLGSPYSIMQWLTLGLGGVASLIVTTNGVLLVGLALAVLTVGVVHVRRHGLELAEWVPLLGAYGARRLEERVSMIATGRKPGRNRMAQRGHRAPAADTSAGGEDPEPDLPSRLPKGTRMLSAEDGEGNTFGVLYNPRDRTLSALVGLRVPAYGQLNPDELMRRQRRWGDLQTGMCREGSPVSRLQWIEGTRKGDADALIDYFIQNRADESGRAGLAVRDYEEMIANMPAATQEHDLHVLLQISEAKAAPQIKRLNSKDRIAGACEVLAGELAPLAEQRLARGVEYRGVMRPEAYARWLRFCFDPFGRQNLERLAIVDPSQSGTSFSNAMPIAEEERMRSYSTDGAVHATYWISGWPQREVTANFMVPILMRTPNNVVRRISVIQEPRSIDRAIGAVERRITLDESANTYKQEKGFALTGRRRKKMEQLLERENDLNNQYGEMRFSGYITISAASEQQLEEVCAEMELKATGQRIQIRRLYGMQAEAFLYTMPLGLGLD